MLKIITLILSYLIIIKKLRRIISPLEVFDDILMVYFTQRDILHKNIFSLQQEFFRSFQNHSKLEISNVLFSYLPGTRLICYKCRSIKNTNERIRMQYLQVVVHICHIRSIAKSLDERFLRFGYSTLFAENAPQITISQKQQKKYFT